MHKLPFVVFMFLLAALVLAQSEDNDTILEFYWGASSGEFNHYNVKVAIVDKPDDIDPGDSSAYTTLGTYLKTDQYSSPQPGAPYPLPLVGEHGKFYYVIVSAESVNGTDLITLTLDFEDDLDSGLPTPELLQEFVNAAVPLSAGATIAFTLRGESKFWVITDTTSQETYPVRKEQGSIIVSDGTEGPNSKPSDYVWCLLQERFVPGQPMQAKGFGG